MSQRNRESLLRFSNGEEHELRYEDVSNGKEFIYQFNDESYKSLIGYSLQLLGVVEDGSALDDEELEDAVRYLHETEDEGGITDLRQNLEYNAAVLRKSRGPAANMRLALKQQMFNIAYINNSVKKGFMDVSLRDEGFIYTDIDDGEKEIFIASKFSQNNAAGMKKYKPRSLENN